MFAAQFRTWILHDFLIYSGFRQDRWTVVHTYSTRRIRWFQHIQLFLRTCFFRKMYHKIDVVLVTFFIRKSSFFNVFLHRIIHRFYVAILMKKYAKITPKSVSEMHINPYFWKPYSKKKSFYALWSPSGALWLTFGLPLAPFLLPLAPFGRPLGSKCLPFGILWLNFIHPGGPFSHFWDLLASFLVPCLYFLWKSR